MAEDFLSSWLEKRGLEPSQCLVGSKWGYYYTAGFKTRVGNLMRSRTIHGPGLRTNQPKATSCWGAT
eukprot:1137947-Pelagomonas_calceolata.AAC.13